MFLFLIGIVSFNRAEVIANKIVSANWPNVISLSESITFYDLEGNPSVYVYVYNSDGSIVKNYLALAHPDYDRWGTDRYVTVIVSANEENQPVMDMSNVLPPYIVNRKRADLKAYKLWGDVRFKDYVYLSPNTEWFRYEKNGEYFYLNGYSLKAENVDIPEYGFNDYEKSSVWDRVDNATFLAQDSGYIKDVPFALWSYGCSPTTNTMIAMFYDIRGYGQLVDFYFDRYDMVEKETDRNLPNAQRELALAMNTDTTTGGTSPSMIGAGMNTFTSNMHPYHFRTTSSSQGNSSNHWHWDMITEEVDSGRPFNWSLLNYWYNQSGHSVCAVGYIVTDAGDSNVIVHNTWDTGEHAWALHTSHQGGTSTDYVYPTKETGDRTPSNISINPMYSRIFKGVKYVISWNLYETELKAASEIDKVESFLQESFNENTHTSLGKVDASKGYLITDIPESDTIVRFFVRGYNGYQLIAADGTLSGLDMDELAVDKDISVVSHHNGVYGGSLSSTVILADDVLLGAYGAPGIYRINLKEGYIASEEKLSSFGAAYLIYVSTSRILIGIDSKGNYEIYSVGSDYTLTKKGEGKFPSSVVYHSLVNNKLYCIIKYKGIYIYSIDGYTLKENGNIELLRAFNGFLDKKNKVMYIASLADGIIKVDVSNASSLSIQDTFSLSGNAMDVKGNDEYLFAAEGTKGIEIVDPSTGSIASKLDLSDNITLLKVSGSKGLYAFGGNGGLHVYGINGSNTTDVGTVSGMGAVKHILQSSNKLYLSIGGDGLMLVSLPASVVSIEKDSKLFDISLKRVCGDFIYLSGNSINAYKYAIFDINGRKVKSGRLSNTISIKDLSQGVYFLSISCNNNKHTMKVVKIK